MDCVSCRSISEVEVSRGRSCDRLDDFKTIASMVRSTCLREKRRGREKPNHHERAIIEILESIESL
jgi:hypothetical protein